VHPADDLDPWSSRDCWRVLFACQDCGSDVVRLVHGNPDEIVRCFNCESQHVHHVSERLLRLALPDLTP
jgi:hypothetical protein